MFKEVFKGVTIVNSISSLGKEVISKSSSFFALSLNQTDSHSLTPNALKKLLKPFKRSCSCLIRAMNERSLGGGTRVRRTSFAGGRSSKTTGIGSRRRLVFKKLRCLLESVIFIFQIIKIEKSKLDSLKKLLVLRCFMKMKRFVDILKEAVVC